MARPTKRIHRGALLALLVIMTLLFGLVVARVLPIAAPIRWLLAFFAALMVVGAPNPPRTIATGVGIVMLVPFLLALQESVAVLVSIGIVESVAFLIGIIGGFLLIGGVVVAGEAGLRRVLYR